MKKSFILTALLALLLPSIGKSQFFNIFTNSDDNKIPTWVQRTQEGRAIDNASDYYYGIGVSSESQDKANTKAREEFAKSVEVKIKSVYEENVKATGKRYSEKIDISNTALTDISIRGISITERYYNNEQEKYYALMQVTKDEYNQIFKDELDKEQERQIAQAAADLNQEKIALEKEKRSNLIKENKTREKVRHSFESRKIKSKRKIIRKATRRDKLITYRSFLGLAPPDKVISFRNGELPTGKHAVSMHLGISPVTIENLYYGFQFWKMTISTNFNGEGGRFNTQEMMIKFQVMPNSGEFHKVSASFGYVEFLHSLSKLDDLESIEPEYSPFLAATMTFPELFHSFGSIYADTRKVSLGINSYPTYDNFDDTLCLLFELHYIGHSGFRNRFGDAILIQAGVRFKTSEHITTSFIYEDHEMFVFGADYVF